MNAFIEQIKCSSTLLKALAVTAGGLLGVFLTLTIFFIIIRVSVKVNKS